MKYIKKYHRTLEHRSNALEIRGVDTKFHKYPNLYHGFGLGLGTSAKGWLEDAVAFWENQIQLEKDKIS